ncbi:MAG: hypothetical protein JO287_19195 [Pseudonocardiales bacterium]|nr:hypothetical protein [Pseudonocardiales bacterium]
MSLRLLYLIFRQLLARLRLLARSAQSNNAEISCCATKSGVRPPGAQTGTSWADHAVFTALTGLLSPVSIRDRDSTFTGCSMPCSPAKACAICAPRCGHPRRMRSPNDGVELSAANCSTGY